MRTIRGSRSVCVIVLLLLLAVPMWGRGQSDQPAGEVLFAIGQEDGSGREFNSDDFMGEHEYSCTVGEDYVPGAFPAFLYRLSTAQVWDEGGVARLTIRFSLAQAHKKIVLRVARSGAETTLVRVDGGRARRVTRSRLHSDERAVYGAYDLRLGRMTEGSHTIELTVAQGERGAGRHGWDAIVLYSR